MGETVLLSLPALGGCPCSLAHSLLPSSMPAMAWWVLRRTPSLWFWLSASLVPFEGFFCLHWSYLDKAGGSLEGELISNNNFTLAGNTTRSQVLGIRTRLSWRGCGIIEILSIHLSLMYIFQNNKGCRCNYKNHCNAEWWCGVQGREGCLPRSN